MKLKKIFIKYLIALIILCNLSLVNVSAEEEYEYQPIDQENPQNGDHANSWRYTDGELSSMPETQSYIEYSTWPKVEGAQAYGIDVSEHQGYIDWTKVKDAGVDYAIIRCGYGDNYSYQDDDYWYQNANACVKYDIPFGTYIYSYATSASQAKSEAEHVLRLIDGYDLTYPVYYDLEDNSIRNKLTTSQVAEYAQIFCDTIEAAGYDVAIYANTDWFTNYLIDSRFGQWDKWVAQYNSECTYNGSYSMWQCSSKGSVNGISGYVDLNVDFSSRLSSVAQPSFLKCQAHVQDIGWQKEKTDGELIGTTGESKRVESLIINKGSNLASIQGEIQYRVHVQDYGTLDWVKTGEVAGTTGQGKRVEALQISLTGDLDKLYDIYYRVHVQQIGWMKWTKGGISDESWSGTNGLSLRVEAVEIVIKNKNEAPPLDDNSGYSYLTKQDIGALFYSGHQETFGDLEIVSSDSVLGKTGLSKRLEGINIFWKDALGDSSIEYQSHIQDIGWQNWKKEGGFSGTSGQSKRLEAVKIRLTGEISKFYDIYYRVHVQNYGWLGWAKNGEIAGTTGISYRIEAIQIKLVSKGENVLTNTIEAYKTVTP